MLIQDINIINNIISLLKKIIGFLKFNDYYEIQTMIGKVKLGIINLRIHKKTNQKVAIKIIYKSSLKIKEDKELIRSEINILDNFKKVDYFFTAMEYI